MMPREPSGMLDRARQDAMLSTGSLWLRYFELGGVGTALELEAYLCGALVPSAHEYDVLVHALNERFFEIAGNHPIPYSDDEDSSSPTNAD
jgi:hypothetical protein